MEKNEITYAVERGKFIDKWLISGVISKPVYGTMVPDSFPDYRPGASVKDEKGKERKSPAKKEFLEKGEFKKLTYPSEIVTDKLYYPSDTNRVDCSRVFKFPADARLYARAYVNCDTDIKITAALFCCGGMKVFINGTPAAEYYPYEANIECRKDVQLCFKKGSNELLVALNDYGERNIVFRFGIKLLDNGLSVSLPIGADVDAIEHMKKCLDGLYTDKLNYHDEDVFLCSDESFSDDFELGISGEDIEPVSRKAVKGKKKVKLFSNDEIVSGYHELTLTTEVEGVELKMALCIQICPKEKERQSMHIDSFEDRKRFCIEYASQSGNELDNYIASLETGSSEYERFDKEIRSDLEFAKKRGDCADFRVQRFLWLLGRFPEKIPEQLRKDIEELVLGFRYWFDEPGNDAMWFFSENHALAFHCDEYIAGSFYPNEVFGNSGLTGQEHMKKAKLRIVEWFEKLLRYGYNEWNSSTYVNVDVFTYITLYCFAKDEEIRTLAKKALDYTFEMYAYNSFKGVMGTSNGRAYDKDILGNECMSGNSQMWLAWGVGCINRRISPALYIAMSDYIPSDENKQIGLGNFEGRLVREKEEGTMKVKTCLCKTSDYIVGTCVSPRTGGPGSQELLLSVFLNDAKTRIWLNLPGEGTVFGMRRPGYFSGNALTPLVSQKENVVVVSYNFPKAFMNRCDVDYIHVMCDKQECDEFILKKNAVFVRRGNAFAAFVCNRPIKPTEKTCLKEKEFVTDRIKSEWLIKVSDLSEFESFKDFVSYMTEHMPKIGSRYLYFDDVSFGKMKFPLLQKSYLLLHVSPKKLLALGVSKDMVKQFLKELLRARR